MLKLLKNMRRKEALMALICLVFVVGQIYFDLRLPDYMTELTMLIKTSGQTEDILNGGQRAAGSRLRLSFRPDSFRLQLCRSGKGLPSCDGHRAGGNV